MTIKKQSYQRIVHPLEPVFDDRSAILILGSFPSVKTRQYGFYYGHPQNRFWPLMEALFKSPVGSSIEEKKGFLINRRIALYDAIYACDIVGSSDASLRNVAPANLGEIFKRANIRRVFCNGASAYQYYEKYQAEKFKMEALKMPSTSPANARYRLNDLVEAWSVILRALRG